MNWPCLLGHSREWHNGPWVEGRRAKLCDRCLQPVGWQMEGEMLSEPLPMVVAGQPIGKVTRERKRNVAEFKRQSER